LVEGERTGGIWLPVDVEQEDPVPERVEDELHPGHVDATRHAITFRLRCCVAAGAGARAGSGQALPFTDRSFLVRISA
jgi:hypothetical protein